MATTTNYSWSTPDDTALVKDGAAAIRSLGTAIDTTVFTNAGAAIAKATVDAKGDLIAGTADNTVARLAVGANDTILVADSSTATGLKWAAPASVTTATFRDEKAAATGAGTFTTGAWRTRDLNTTQFNNIASASLSSNQITLVAGTYQINASAPAFQVDQHILRWQNITDTSTVMIGSSAYSQNTTNATTHSFISGTFTIAATKVFELQHQCVTTRSGVGFGNENSMDTNVYAVVTLDKVG
jgi:hypothetical protein